MATMIEKQIAKANKDIEKYQKSIARHTALLEKAQAKCDELNCNWTWEQWIEHRESKTYTDDQYWAWSKRNSEQDEIKDAEERMAYSVKQLEKLTGKAEAKAQEQAEADRISEIESGWWKAVREELEKTPEQRQAEYEAWLKQFKAECLKDGIIIEHVDNTCINGKTARGSRFAMYDNNGFTDRSLHCYTLYINGECIFTSGDFSTAYSRIRK